MPPDVERPGRGDNPRSGPEQLDAAGGSRLDPILCRPADDRHEDATDTPTTGLTRESARRLTERIKLLLGSLVEQHQKIIVLVTEARAGHAEAALGYRSWTEYAAAEFAGICAGLPQAQRAPISQQLAAAGMSSRTIAPMVGVDQKTVVRDLRHGASPAVGSDEPGDMGMTEPTGARVDIEVGELVVPITGRDGKSYPRPAAPFTSRKTRRNPLPDQYRNRATDLLKAVQALARLHQDDRFPTNRDAVRDRNASELTHAANELLDLLDDLKIDRSGGAGS